MRVIFSLAPKAIQQLFPKHIIVPKHLAYVEWFTKFRAQPEPNHQLYAVSRAFDNGYRVSTIVPVTKMDRSVHLFPAFGSTTPQQWTSNNVLDECRNFLVNAYADRDTFILFKT